MIQYVFGDDLICICWWFHIHLLMINYVFTDDAERKFLSGQKEVGLEVWVVPAVPTSIDGSIIIASNRAINGIKYTRTNTLNDVEYKYCKPHVKSKQLIDRLHSTSTSDELRCFSTTLAPVISYFGFKHTKYKFLDLLINDFWILIWNNDLWLYFFIYFDTIYTRLRTALPTRRSLLPKLCPVGVARSPDRRADNAAFVLISFVANIWFPELANQICPVGNLTDFVAWHLIPSKSDATPLVAASTVCLVC